MQRESTAVLMRIFIGESDKHGGKNLYQHLVEHLRKNHFAGVTVLRGIAGFGKASKLHTTNLLELSSDLPIVIEIVDKDEKIDELKKYFNETDIIGSALITEEQVKIYQYGEKK